MLPFYPEVCIALTIPCTDFLLNQPKKSFTICSYNYLYTFILQWRIYIQKFPAHAPSPTGPNSFVFAYIFTKKCPRRRSTTPPGPRPLREILDPPLFCNTVTTTLINVMVELRTVPTEQLHYSCTNTLVGICNLR